MRCMSMTPKLLIVTTFYNEEERLQQTLNNMLEQSDTDFVHLIIDDGSTINRADKIVEEYISKCKHKVIFEKHKNAGINMVHMQAFQRTTEFNCTHFMWLDCGDGLQKNAVQIINKQIERRPEFWFHLDGYYVSEKNSKKIRMSSRSYRPYLKKKDQFIPFCFSISTYGHFVIPYDIYKKFNPEFGMVDGFYYDAQIIGALSLNGCPHYFINQPLSIIEDDCHFSVSNATSSSYVQNVQKLAEFVVDDAEKRKRIFDISSGMYSISINKLVSIHYFKNRKNIKALKRFYKKNGVCFRDRYKCAALCILSILHFC